MDLKYQTVIHYKGSDDVSYEFNTEFEANAFKSMYLLNFPHGKATVSPISEQEVQDA